MPKLSLLPSERQPEQDRTVARRIGPLATLPLFFKLEGQRVLVAGGSEAAAWKAELLIAAGAQVDLFAKDLDPAFQLLLNDSTLPGCINWNCGTWTAASLSGAVIAVADVESDAEARAFHDAGRASGVPVNVIDKPRYCSFSFGSIVNRSPVVIGISSDGVSPILTQAIRRRVETLLPRSLANWGRLARKLRHQLSNRLPSKRQRRLFWETFSERAFGAAPEAAAVESLFAGCHEPAPGGSDGFGQVTLVGAGPGDAEFLTLKAVRALQAADVILYDNLVSDEVLELARREAKRMLVGKRGGRKSCRQEDINEMMIKLAKAGKNVVRLKSGDPMIFGRAGEEIARLQDEGIVVSSIPGITAGVAMASALGISLTHRDHAQSVRFVTGHCRKGTLPDDVDWRAIADPKATTVFYMARGTAGQIADSLMAKDLDPAMPVVACSALSRPGEKIWHGSLEGLGAAIETLDRNEPTLVAVGSVFKGSQELAQAQPNITRNGCSAEL